RLIRDGCEVATTAHSAAKSQLGLTCKVLSKPVPRHRKLFGQHSRFAHDRYKIRVTGPARDYVKVEMVCDSRPGRLSKVHPDVGRVRLILGPERGLGACGQLHHLGQRRFVYFSEGRRVVIGHDHQMARCVRIQIEDHKVERRSMHDEVAIVLLFTDYSAEDAAGFALDICEVSIPPGTPEVIHGAASTSTGIRTRAARREL